MDTEKCYTYIEDCKQNIEMLIAECENNDGNSLFLALNLIKDLDRLKKCISIERHAK